MIIHLHLFKMSTFFNNDYIATWSSNGTVNVFDIGENLKNLCYSNKTPKSISNKTPLYSFTGHNVDFSY